MWEGGREAVNAAGASWDGQRQKETQTDRGRETQTHRDTLGIRDRHG